MENSVQHWFVVKMRTALVWSDMLNNYNKLVGFSTFGRLENQKQKLL